MEAIRATVDGGIVLHDCPAKSAERLRLGLSVPNPKRATAERFGIFGADEIAERIEVTQFLPSGDVRLPRGATNMVREILAKDKRTFKIERDARASGSPISIAKAVPMRDYQLEGIDLLRRFLQGIIVLPCGCGKTRLGVGAVAALRTTTLIIVHTQDLADQWTETLATLLGIEAGLVGAGKCEIDRDVVVAIDDSLAPLLRRQPDACQRFGLCILDEAHHAPALTMQTILLQVPARYRLGLTATPDRDDGCTRIMDWSFGPRLLERETREMIKLGYLVPAEIEFIETGFVPPFDPDGVDEKKRANLVETSLVQDLLRNEAILDVMEREVAAGEIVLVLTGRKGHVSDLSEGASARGFEARGLTSATGKRKRKKAIEEMRSGVCRCSIATSLADEGLDIERLSRILLVFPSGARVGTAQRLGRLLRKFPGKKPKLFDFVDGAVPMLARRAKDRRKIYKDSGLLP